VKVVKASAGWKHTTFLDDQNRIYSCGNNENGQLGIASRSVQQVPKLIENFDLQASQVSSGKHHTLILTISGLVYSVGSNKEG
jgi:alpha-tubulin suppressor-like RCC1 family protein